MERKVKFLTMDNEEQQVSQIDLQILLENNKYALQENRILKLTEAILSLMGLANYELSLMVVGDKKIRELNRDYRNKDKATDVLSFPQVEWQKPLMVSDTDLRERESILPKVLGDLVISLDHVAINAENIGNSLAREFCFLIIHGVLHLCGHDHMEEQEEKIMIAEQQKLLDQLREINTDDSKPLWFDCVTFQKRNNN